MSPYTPPTLAEVIKIAMSVTNSPNMFIQRIEDFLADKFQSHMTGVPNFDVPLQKLFESIAGRKLN